MADLCLLISFLHETAAGERGVPAPWRRSPPGMKLAATLQDRLDASEPDQLPLQGLTPASAEARRLRPGELEHIKENKRPSCR